MVVGRHGDRVGRHQLVGPSLPEHGLLDDGGGLRARGAFEVPADEHEPDALHEGTARGEEHAETDEPVGEPVTGAGRRLGGPIAVTAPGPQHGPQHTPAVHRIGGQQVEHSEADVDERRATTARRRPGRGATRPSRAPRHPGRSPPRPRLVAGPAIAILQLLARRRHLRLELRHPAEHPQGDAPDRRRRTSGRAASAPARGSPTRRRRAVRPPPPRPRRRPRARRARGRAGHRRPGPR